MQACTPIPRIDEARITWLPVPEPIWLSSLKAMLTRYRMARAIIVGARKDSTTILISMTWENYQSLIVFSF